jgi:hypothetical protein
MPGGSGVGGCDDDVGVANRPREATWRQPPSRRETDLDEATATRRVGQQLIDRHARHRHRRARSKRPNDAHVAVVTSTPCCSTSSIVSRNGVDALALLGGRDVAGSSVRRVVHLERTSTAPPIELSSFGNQRSPRMLR